VTVHLFENESYVLEITDFRRDEYFASHPTNKLSVYYLWIAGFSFRSPSDSQEIPEF
jgi:hypothetical protein